MIPIPKFRFPNPVYSFKIYSNEVILTSIFQMDVSENRGTPKSSILIGFSSINHPFWGPYFWKHPNLKPFFCIQFHLHRPGSALYHQKGGRVFENSLDLQRVLVPVVFNKGSLYETNPKLCTISKGAIP